MDSKVPWEGILAQAQLHRQGGNQQKHLRENSAQVVSLTYGLKWMKIKKPLLSKHMYWYLYNIYIIIKKNIWIICVGEWVKTL